MRKALKALEIKLKLLLTKQRKQLLLLVGKLVIFYRSHEFLYGLTVGCLGSLLAEAVLRLVEVVFELLFG